MRRARLLAVLPVAVLTAALAACGGGGPGQVAARSACAAYANTGRHQGATTAAGFDAIRTRARTYAGRAATADRSFTDLRRDIDEAYAREGTLRAATAGQLDAYFAADRRVEADCRAAGADIGPLRP